MPTNIEIRDFIIEHFSRGELDAFCHDYFPEVYEDNEGTGIEKSVYARRLVEYCERRSFIQNMLVALQKERPQPFAQRIGSVKVEAVPIRARNPKQVFISHAYQDAEFAHHLAVDLQEAGLSVWLAPDNIKPGEMWMAAIDRGLKESGVFVAVLTSRAVASEWVRDETNVALSFDRNRQMRVLPLMVEPCKVSDLSVWLSNKQYIPFTDSYAHGLAQLLMALGIHTVPQHSQEVAESYHDRGIICWNEGDFDGAIVNFTRAIELQSDYAEAYHNRGVANWKKGNYDHAIANFSQAIELQADYAQAYYGRGLAYYDKGSYDQAIEDNAQAIKLQPDFVDAYNNRGLAYDRRGDYDQAIADFDQAIKLQPDYAKAYFNRGLAYRIRGHSDQAIADFDQAIKLQPDYGKAYHNRGLAYCNKDDFDRAIENFTRAIELKSNDAEAYHNRGLAHKAKADQEHAIADFKKTLELSKDPALCAKAKEALLELELRP